MFAQTSTKAMASEVPANEFLSPKRNGKKVTGVYGANVVPGTYLKTVTGVQRGEELFHRPDLERPWRTSTTQQHAALVALKEKEIEELMRRCSTLRTQLGNARHDAKYLEFAISEKAKTQVSEIRDECNRLETELKTVANEKRELKEVTEHQLRLMKAQQEKETLQLRTECRMHRDRCDELTSIYQQQIEDIKKAAARELEHVEGLCNARVEELTCELTAMRASKRAHEERHAAELADVKNLLHRVESDYKERIRAAEQRVDEVRSRLENENKKLQEQHTAALKEARVATEHLAVSLADGEEMLERFKQWNAYTLQVLDRFYTSLMEAAPEFATEPHDPELHEVPSLYAPRKILEEPETKLTMERIVYRLLQLKHSNYVPGIQKSEGGPERDILEELEELSAKQERLSCALKEMDAKCQESNLSLGRVLSRLYFFSDDLENAIANAGPILPPRKNVVFVCVHVFQGAHLWAEDGETASASIALMNFAIRPKMTEYGGYECYSDGTSLLLAFDDPIAACRFCVEAQHWLLNLPWPDALLRTAHGKVIYSEKKTLLFRGLRLAMGVHTGDVFAEGTAIPCGDAYRCHYYGRAVSQVMHISSLAKGGQTLVTQPVWDMCGSRRYELSSVLTREVGTFPILSFSKEKNAYEREPFALYQMLPHPLKERTFARMETSEVPITSALATMRRALIATEIDCLEGRRVSLGDAVSAAKDEFLAVDRHIHALMDKARGVKSYFHLLPPPEMVTQMNDLYGVMEKIAARATDLRVQLGTMGDFQEDISVQTRGLKDYCARHASMAAREEEMQLQAEMMQSHYEEQMREMRQSWSDEVERLRGELRERDIIIKRLYKKNATTAIDA